MVLVYGTRADNCELLLWRLNEAIHIQHMAHSKCWLNIIWYYHIQPEFISSALSVSLWQVDSSSSISSLRKWELYLSFPNSLPWPSNHPVLTVGCCITPFLGSPRLPSSVPSCWCPFLDYRKASHLISLPPVLPLANPFFTPCSQSDQSKMRIKLCNFPEGFALPSGWSPVFLIGFWSQSEHELCSPLQSQLPNSHSFQFLCFL